MRGGRTGKPSKSGAMKEILANLDGSNVKRAEHKGRDAHSRRRGEAVSAGSAEAERTRGRDVAAGVCGPRLVR